MVFVLRHTSVTRPTTERGNHSKLTWAAMAPLSFRRFAGGPDPEGLEVAEDGSASIFHPKVKGAKLCGGYNTFLSFSFSSLVLLSRLFGLGNRQDSMSRWAGC